MQGLNLGECVDPDKGSAKWIADECILEVCVLVRERKRDKQTADRQQTDRDRDRERDRERETERFLTLTHSMADTQLKQGPS